MKPAGMLLLPQSNPCQSYRASENCFPYLLHSRLTRTELILTRMRQLKAPTIRPGMHAGLTTAHTTDPIINTKIVAHRLVSSASLLAISSTFNSLFKVLFIFPSRYLFAIGVMSIFSFSGNLPAIQSCNPKQLDSMNTRRTWRTPDQRRDSHPL